MAGIIRVGFLTVLSFVLFAGCSKSAPSSAEATSAGGGEKQANSQVDPNTDPIAHAAADFLDAVLKGDTQRGSARLTPKAMARIVATGEHFDPPGVENPTFSIIEVRAPVEDHAFAQCELRFTEGGKAMREEMCCELRKIDNDWRVSGIAYEPAPGKPWTLSDFETGQNIPITRQPPDATSNPMAADGGTGRPSPPRTAQEAPAADPATLRR